MSAAEILEEIRRLPEKERRELVEDIGQEFLDFDQRLTSEEVAELDRRAAEFDKNPEVGVPWEQARAEMHKRMGWK